jgi:nitrate reductase assembly molybdenum cofactor insertion protein NarJ
MSEYQNDEITKNRGEKLLDVTQEYNENERLKMNLRAF